MPMQYPSSIGHASNSMHHHGKMSYEKTLRNRSDHILARDVFAVESNNGTLYRQRVEPWISNFAKKMRNGTYKRSKAIQALATYLSPDAIARYSAGSESYSPSSRVSRVDRMFTPIKTNKATKLEIASLWLPQIEKSAKYQATETALERNKKGIKLTDAEVHMIRKEWKLEK